MNRDYDVMLTGIAAAQVMRAAFMGLEKGPLVGSEDGSDIEEERYSDHALYGPPVDVETPILEAIDWRRHGNEADARFFRDMRRLTARLALPAIIEQKLELVADVDGKLPILERIRAAQEGRHIQHLAILRRGQPPTIPAPAPETAPEIADTKPEIVHAPIGDTASPEYVAEQQQLEQVLRTQHSEAHRMLSGMGRGNLLFLVQAHDALRSGASDPDVFDDRWSRQVTDAITVAQGQRDNRHERAMPGIAQAIHAHAPNRTRRDSERP